MYVKLIKNEKMKKNDTEKRKQEKNEKMVNIGKREQKLQIKK